MPLRITRRMPIKSTRRSNQSDQVTRNGMLLSTILRLDMLGWCLLCFASAPPRASAVGPVRRRELCLLLLSEFLCVLCTSRKMEGFQKNGWQILAAAVSLAAGAPPIVTPSHCLSPPGRGAGGSRGHFSTMQRPKMPYWTSRLQQQAKGRTKAPGYA